MAQTALNLSSDFIDRRYHLPVMSECDADCRLCGALGCLRPARITFPELLNELDVAARRCTSTVVFPPNFLNHPEAAQFCMEVARRGLEAVVRIRPSQLVTSHELLNTLEYRSAKFEVIVADAIPVTALSSPLPFKTVFVPSKSVDAGLLYESIPFTWRTSLTVMAPLPSVFDDALSADELFLFLSSLERPLQAYPDFTRSVQGRLPGLAAKRTFVSGDAELVRLSCILTIERDDSFESIRARLDALAHQSLEAAFFEICIACDRVSDELVEQLMAWASEHREVSLQILRLSDGWGQPPFRRTQALNLAATYARGTHLLFLSSSFRVEHEFLKQCAERSADCLLIDQRAIEKPAREALLLSVRHYFDIAGFAESIEHQGFEFEFAKWASNLLGVAFTIWIIGDVDKAGVPVRSAKKNPSSDRMMSAQEFFYSSLDLETYRSLYPLMGSHPRWRRLFRFVTALGLVQWMISTAARLRNRGGAARIRREMRQSIRALEALP